jgi:hypothetical protein
MSLICTHWLYCRAAFANPPICEHSAPHKRINNYGGCKLMRCRRIHQNVRCKRMKGGEKK